MISLRPDQSTLIDAVRAGFAKHRSILMVAPTGFGKTVVFCWLANAVAAKQKTVYILVHRDELVEQVSATLKQFHVEHGFVAAGRVSTPHQVMVCSVFTLVNRVRDYPVPDLCIIDEAHHACSGSTWARVLHHYAASYKLGVTATPIRLDGRDLSGQFEALVEGPSVADLIAAGNLSPYRLYAPPVSLGKLQIRSGDYVKSELVQAVDKPAITGDAVAHYAKLASGRRALAFCVSLEHASHVASEFQQAGYASARIDGGMDRSARRKLVADFTAGRIQVMTSCDLVSEGFDLPAIECIIGLRPTASLGLCMQQWGRGLRVFPGKEYALILDHAGNAGTHGLPDDDRLWRLGDAKTKTKRRVRQVFSVRTCGRCFAAARPGTMVCPYCQWEWPVESREVLQKAGELVEVKDVDRAKIEARREVGMAKGLDALVALEKQRGYRPGWALHVWGARRRA